jgi:ribosomal protein S18 acetylase RimI-like enzyme
MQIRRLKSDDLDAVVAVHMERFPDSRSTQLGKAFLRKMYCWFLLNYPELSLVATIDDQVVGLAVGSIGGYGRRVFRYALPQVIWGFVTHPQLLFRDRMFYLWRSYLRGLYPKSAKTLAAPPDSSKPVIRQAAFASLAVLHTATGVGIPLILAFERAAREHGANRIGHTVKKENVSARKIYEGLGWKFRGESDHSVSFYKEFFRS